MVDATDVHDFKVKLQTLKTTWDELCPEFYEWFVKVESDLFCTSMIRSVHFSAGLGFSPPLYTTNNNESINRLLKGKGIFQETRMA